MPSSNPPESPIPQPQTLRRSWRTWPRSIAVRLWRLLVRMIQCLHQTPEEEPSVWDTLLTWPARLLIVAGALVVGLIWEDTPIGVQLGWALQYGLLAAVAIVTSFWFWILLVNLAVAVLWLALSWSAPADADSSAGWTFRDIVTWANRQVGHIEALAAWVAIAFVLKPRLCVQGPLLAAVIFWGPPIINALARWDFVGGAAARHSRAALMMERRSLIYLASLVGLLILVVQAPHQFWAIFPLLLTVIPGLSLRYIRFRRRKYLERRSAEVAAIADRARGNVEADPGEVRGKTFRDFRMSRARMQARVAPVADLFGPIVVIGLFVAMTVLSLWQRHQMAVDARSDEDGHSPPEDACLPEPGGPKSSDVALFILSDTQLHHLDGMRFPGQMEVADRLVPVARRPIELDILSTAAVVRYQTVYDTLLKERVSAGLSPLLWAHLGDFADLSCIDEMDRMLKLLDGYGGKRKLLAGIAPGNHDSNFTGNFGWSPYWDSACAVSNDEGVKKDKAARNQRSNKAASDQRVERTLKKYLMNANDTHSLSGWAPSAFFGNSLLSRHTVTRLGVLPEHGTTHKRGVIGVFIDTSDRFSRNFGIAGSFGTFSERQQLAILDQVNQQRMGRDETDPWADPLFVVFGHHPYNELTMNSREALDGLIKGLDVPVGKNCNDDCRAPHVLALITAHTHIAESHRHCVAQRLVREIVVGSVIDPPQQASILEIGLDARGRAAVRLSTLPTVARSGFMCSAAHTIDAGMCRRAMAALATAPECQDVVVGSDAGDEPGQACESMERPLSTDEQVAGLIRHGGPQDPNELKNSEEKRARALLRCVCRDIPVVQETSDPKSPQIVIQKAPQACALREPPLKNEAYAPIVEAVARDPLRQQEVACLAWAAAAVQAHKAAGMKMADAIRCAFDDPTLPAAQVTVAAREDVTCH